MIKFENLVFAMLISDVVWQSLIAAACTLILAWMQRSTRQVVKQIGNDAAIKVEAVKKDLEVTTVTNNANIKEIRVTGEKVHKLVNSAMGAQLKLGAELSRWKANQTKLPVDFVAADLADEKHADHERQQAAVDATPTVIVVAPKI